MLEARVGSIVNVSSTAGLGGVPRKSHYGMAKAGLRTLTKVAAKEVGPTGIRVNRLVPGGIQTELLRRYWRRWPRSGACLGADPGPGRQLPAARRVATSEEVAACALFLAPTRPAP